MSEEPIGEELAHNIRVLTARAHAAADVRVMFDKVAEIIGRREARQLFRAAAGSQSDRREMERDMAACNSMAILMSCMEKGVSVQSAAEYLAEANNRAPGVYAVRGGKTTPGAVEQRLRCLLRRECPKTASPLLKNLIEYAIEVQSWAPPRKTGRPPKRKK